MSSHYAVSSLCSCLHINRSSYYYYQKAKSLQLEKELPDGVYLHLYNECTRTGKKEGWALKSEWGARQSPFALITVDGTPKKAFYSEAGDVIVELLKYLDL